MQQEIPLENHNQCFIEYSTINQIERAKTQKNLDKCQENQNQNNNKHMAHYRLQELKDAQAYQGCQKEDNKFEYLKNENKILKPFEQQSYIDNFLIFFMYLRITMDFIQAIKGLFQNINELFRMKQHSGNVGTNYHYLFLKQYIAQIKNNSQKLKQTVRNNVPEQICLEMQKYPLENQKGILNHLFSIVSKQPWAKKIMQEMTQKLLQKAKDLYEFQTQRNYFLVQNFRQTCNQPIVQSTPQCFNLSCLFKVNINKQLRRTIWSKCLYVESNKFEFFKYDHKLIPYNLSQQFSVGLVRLSLQNKIKLKENQKDCCLRLLQYVVKKWDKIPNKSEQYLALNVVDVYAHYTPTRIQQIGSVYVGLKELTEIYFQQNLQKRLGYIRLAFELVDAETFKIIQTNYLPYSQKNNAQLNQCFEHFRLTLTAAFLPLTGAQFIIDQLLIKKKNKLDMYVIFAMMAMIMSDDLEKYKQAKMQLTDIINPQNTKKTIKLEDITDAFRVIYQNIDPFHQTSNEVHQINRLLENLIKFDQQVQKNSKRQDEVVSSAPASLKIIEPLDKMAGFIVEQKNQVLRLGTQIKNQNNR